MHFVFSVDVEGRRFSVGDIIYWGNLPGLYRIEGLKPDGRAALSWIDEENGAEHLQDNLERLVETKRGGVLFRVTGNPASVVLPEKWVRLTYPGFPMTGALGKVISISRGFSALVEWDPGCGVPHCGRQSTWRLEYLTRVGNFPQVQRMVAA